MLWGDGGEEMIQQGIATTMDLDSGRRDQDISAVDTGTIQEERVLDQRAPREILSSSNTSLMKEFTQQERSFHERRSTAYFTYLLLLFGKGPVEKKQRNWRHQMLERKMTGDQFISKFS